MFLKGFNGSSTSMGQCYVSSSVLKDLILPKLQSVLHNVLYHVYSDDCSFMEALNDKMLPFRIRDYEIPKSENFIA